MKILMSWQARKNDFNQDDTVNLNGPTIEFHKFFYNEYDKHILLSSEVAYDPLLQSLEKAIEKTAGDRNVEKTYLDVEDILDLEEIQPKIMKLLTEYKDYEIHLFISTGTTAMKIAWILSYLSLPHLNIKMGHIEKLGD